MVMTSDLTTALCSRFGEGSLEPEATRDETTTFWTPQGKIVEILTWLKTETPQPFPMLYDLSATDLRACKKQLNGHSKFDFSVVYHLYSFDRNAFLRLEVGLEGDYPSPPTVTHIWPSANWYEREAYDMFGIRFEGHPHLRRILMPVTWN